MELRRGRDALVGVRLTAWPMPRVRALASTRAGDADPPERARLKFPTAAIAVLECTGTWRELGPERARLATSVGAVMRDIRLTCIGRLGGTGGLERRKLPVAPRDGHDPGEPGRTEVTVLRISAQSRVDRQHLPPHLAFSGHLVPFAPDLAQGG
jgi:hypothetical protein